MVLDYLTYLFTFLLGVCIGSFLNCVVYRLESKKSLAGRSFCPHCKHILSWKDLIPVLSFLFLKGKCRYCKEKISWQYPAVEVATGLIFLLILNFKFEILNQFEITEFLNLGFLFYVSSALIVIFIYDLKHYLIPDKVLFPAIFITLIFRLIFISGFLNYLLAVLIASGFFLAIFLVSGGKWMGFGDVKLAILMGLLLGFPNILVALFLAFFLGAIIGTAGMIFKRKTLKSEIPFGPFLIAGTFLALFWGQQIINWYFNILKI
ncbi:MAG: hypothetical protein A2599_02330 [Candidatus Staskawiczbacteria bacterium RIFOXYD1_FULL_39_28]|uniref:Prepilin peptidase n=1 Tax=Candidatus Staskawiczbacteria bacterium RIFOXYC1_FULL_38_18 TaxID=1802229 RepID=A0A1G2JAZ4_9BACT|nr:MAG: hypothetical protein A2401_01940 [Candidatus Staskawiczbacteria bacterium RIFOXYC1_FULL_38_18]OGZ89915.1 MAG: hypothetical protein A2599_02330 [Candidatus Staskawiczbacteria bacterium RIFOXYD1_FULL_39_28]